MGVKNISVLDLIINCIIIAIDHLPHRKIMLSKHKCKKKKKTFLRAQSSQPNYLMYTMLS